MFQKRLFKMAVKRDAMEHKCGISNEDLVTAFELADKDKSGELDYEELRSLMHSMDPTIQEEDIMELMRYIAVDEGGKLSFTVRILSTRKLDFGWKLSRLYLIMRSSQTSDTGKQALSIT